MDHRRSCRRPGRLIAFILTSFVAAWPATVRAQVFETIGVRAQGMGGAFVAVADDATATWWNPAGIAVGPFASSVLEYDKVTDPAAERARALAITVPSLGLSYYRLQLNQIQPTAPIAPTGSIRQDPGAFTQLGATVGQSIGNAFVVAATLKVQHAFDDTAAGFDVGLIVKSTHVRGAFVVRNVTEPTLGTGADAFTATRQARAGVAFSTGTSSTDGEAVIAADADLTRTPSVAGDERHLAAGVELWAPGRRIGVRGGGAVNTTGDRRGSSSVGVSLALRKGLFADGQLTSGSDEARKGWGIDLRLTF